MESKGLPEGLLSVFSQTLFLNNPPTFLLDFQGFRRSECLKKGYHKAIRKKVPLKTYLWLKSGQEMLILEYFFARDGALFLHFFYVFSALDKGSPNTQKGHKIKPKCSKKVPKWTQKEVRKGQPYGSLDYTYMFFFGPARWRNGACVNGYIYIYI